MELNKMLHYLQNLGVVMDEQMRVDLERRAVEILEKRRIEQGLTVDAFAAKLYPDIPIQNARMNLNRLRFRQTTGKPKRLLYGDFIDMCIALDIPPERVISQTILDIIDNEKNKKNN